MTQKIWNVIDTSGSSIPPYSCQTLSSHTAVSSRTTNSISTCIFRSLRTLARVKAERMLWIQESHNPATFHLFLLIPACCCKCALKLHDVVTITLEFHPQVSGEFYFFFTSSVFGETATIFAISSTSEADSVEVDLICPRRSWRSRRIHLLRATNVSMKMCPVEMKNPRRLYEVGEVLLSHPSLFRLQVCFHCYRTFPWDE